MPIELTVVTPEGEAFSGPVDQVVLPGSEGEFGVLELHERFLSALHHGPMEIRSADGNKLYVVSDGFAKVNAEGVVVLVDSVHAADEIDIEAVRSAHESATSELASLADEDEERRAELEDALVRASAHIEVHGRR